MKMQSLENEKKDFLDQNKTKQNKKLESVKMRVKKI